MKLEFSKTTLPLDLGGYNQTYAGTIVHVWVNPPRKVMDEQRMLLLDYARIIKAEQEAPGAANGGMLGKLFGANPLARAQKKQHEWLARLWSQSADEESRWTAKEVEELFETDPLLYAWLTRESVKLLESYRAEKKK
jgi:hypothetical protein